MGVLRTRVYNSLFCEFGEVLPKTSHQPRHVGVRIGSTISAHRIPCSICKYGSLSYRNYIRFYSSSIIRTPATERCYDTTCIGSTNCKYAVSICGAGYKFIVIHPGAVIACTYRYNDPFMSSKVGSPCYDAGITIPLRISEVIDGIVKYI